MKTLILMIVFLAALIFACSGPKGVVKIEKPEVVTPDDSLEYELLTFDGRFENWYILQNTPPKYRSQEYYESWNKQYVAQWNYLSMQSAKSNFFEYIHGYEPTTDYGFELNHKLFYYFQYVENVLKIQILPAGPKAVTF
jgi:hypothetical protein